MRGTFPACCPSAASGPARSAAPVPARKVRRSINGSPRRQSASQARGDAGRWETGPGPCRSPPHWLGGSLAESVPLGFLSEGVSQRRRMRPKVRGVDSQVPREFAWGALGNTALRITLKTQRLDCFCLKGYEPLCGSGFSHEGECEQTCHQAGWPVGATTGTNERSSDPAARLRGLEVAFQSLTSHDGP